MAVTGSVANAAPRIANFTGGGAITVFGRVRAVSHPDWGAVLAMWRPGVNGSLLQFNGSSNNLVLGTGNGITGTLLAVSLDVWYDYAMTYTGTPGAGTLIGYARATGDATAFASITHTGLDADPGTIYLGGSGDGEYVVGPRCDLRIWNAVLSAAEIEAERWRGAPARRTSLWAFSPVYTPADTGDQSGNSRPWANGGTAPTQADHAPIGPAFGVDVGWEGAFTAAGGSPTAYTLTADPGAFAVAGTAANLLYGRRMPADAGAYSVAGTAANLLFGRKLAADAGAYTIAGTDAGLSRTWEVVADPGAYAIAGTDATFRRGYVVAADAGAFAVAGTDAALKFARIFAADPGAFLIVGTDATLVHGTPGDYTLVADGGAFAIAGVDAGLLAARRITADPGAYAWSGTAASLLATRRITAEAGVYLVTGSDATLIWSGAIILAYLTGRLTVRPTLTGSLTVSPALAGTLTVEPS